MIRRCRLVVFIIALLLAPLSFPAPIQAVAPAQPPIVSSDDALIAQLQQSTNNSVRIARHSETGKVRFIGTLPQQPIRRAANVAATASAEQSARAFLGTYGTLFGVADQARELAAVRDVPMGRRSFVRFQQRVQDIPVLAGELIVQVDQDRNVVSASGELLPDIRQRPVVAIDGVAARKAAVALVAREYNLAASALQSSEPQLWWFNPALLGGPGLRRTSLNWRLEVTSGGTVPVRELVLVDAQNSLVTLHFNQIVAGKKRHVCDDKNAIDPDSDETNNCVPAKYVRNEGSGPTGKADVDLAYDYSGVTYDYFRTNFNRDSLDNKGLPLISLVRYCPTSTDCPYENAFWDGQQMTYGDGFASADDVVAHELTHGFTEFSSHLFYYYQSGAINESMSDVFGELIDLSDGRGNDTPEMRWKLGEDLPASVGIIRDMNDPTLFGDPDRTGSTLYKSDDADNGGVHSNSGVNNKALALMVDGGTFNGYTIAGIGAFKAGWVYYVTNNALLVSGSDYRDLYDALQASCTSLVGTITSAADCAEVAKVVNATEMDRSPATLNVSDAPVCTAGQTVANAFLDDLENPASGNWASSSLSGPNGWHYPPNVDPGSNQYFIDGVYATSGKLNIWGENPAEVSDSVIAMTRDVVVPPNSFFHFNHAYAFDSGNYARYDGGIVEYSTTSGASWSDAGPLFNANGYNALLNATYGNPLGGRRAFGGISKGYYASRVDLSSLAGQKVRFRFRMASDNSFGGMGWFIDDVRIASCAGIGASPPLITALGDLAVTQGGAAVQTNIASVEDAQDDKGSLTVSVSNVPAGMQVTVRNEFGVVSAVVGAGCTTAPDSYPLTLSVTDSAGSSDTIGVTVVVLPAGRPVADESFEQGSPNPHWTSGSTTYGSVICSVAKCGSLPTVAAPHTGDWWTWFGSSSNIEDGFVEQAVTIPAGQVALDFVLWIGNHSGNGATDYVRVLINGNEVFRASDTDAAYDSGYTPVHIDVSKYAGGQRVLRIESHNGPSPAAFVANVDDVMVSAVANGCNAQPLVAFADTAMTVSKRAGSVALTVMLTSPALVPVQVDYATVAETAVAGVDYTAVGGTLTFDVGVTSQQINVPILDNPQASGNKTLIVTLDHGRNAVVSDTTSRTTLTITSDEYPVSNAYTVYLPVVER